MGKKKSPKPRSSAAEVALRVEEVLRIRLDGAQFHDVVHFASEKGWGVSDRQVATYIRRADDLLVERQDRSRARTIARRVAQREALFARCINAADYRTALAILTDLDKLRGLYPEKELKELVRLAAAQAGRLRELEARLDHAARQAPGDPPSPAATTGPAGGADPGGAGGAAGGVPG
jgi:hypothetical protein